MLFPFFNLPLTIDQVSLATKLHLSQLTFRFTLLLITIIILFSICLFLRKVLQKNSRFVLIFIFLFLLSPWTNYLINFAPSFPQYLFITKLNPTKLAAEINNRQNIEYLATNKTYILPALARKLTYNKPFWGEDLLLNHFISFFDLEQTVSPASSYEIISLSGIPPKGVPQIFYFWDIFAIIFGAYLLINQKKGRFLLICFLITLTPYLIFEKKYFHTTSILFLPLAIYLETEFFYYLKKIPFWFLAIMSLGVVNYYYHFYGKPKEYLTPDLFLYQKISQVISSHPDKEFIITNRFGPTDLMLNYYTNSLPNYQIKSFQLGKTDEPQTIPEINKTYVGLIGEFVGTGRHLDQRDLPANFHLETKIDIDGQLVADYGNQILIGKFK